MRLGIEVPDEEDDLDFAGFIAFLVNPQPPIAPAGCSWIALENGPNDLAVAGEWAYFTDPVYAFLELERFEDLPYLDEAVRERGAGVTGIYRARLRAPGASSPPPAAELLDASLSRPNGIAVLPPDRGAGASARERLVVSECCQGEHNAACAQGVKSPSLEPPRELSFAPSAGTADFLNIGCTFAAQPEQS